VVVSLVRIHCVLVFFSMNTALPVSCPLFFLPLLRYFTFTIHIRKFLEKFYSKDLFDESLKHMFPRCIYLFIIYILLDPSYLQVIVHL